uniref:Dehydrogenase/reductase (SDR family) member 11b n=1 Tax=Stegastes partitus TaxID=144197 RepID=A0A3B5BBP2_9TELE
MMITKDCKYKLFFLQLYSSCVADCLLCFSFWFQEVAAECKKAGYTGVLVPIKCDLSKEEKILSMFAAIKEQHKGVDVCINNAGLARPDQLLNGKTGGWKTMLDVNVIGLSICTREAYQSMKERNVDDGHIIHINSMSGHRTTPMADIHFYSATKFAVTALTEGLRQELREAKSHIRATGSHHLLHVEVEFCPSRHEGGDDYIFLSGVVCLKSGEVGVEVVGEGCWAAACQLDGPVRCGSGCSQHPCF